MWILIKENNFDQVFQIRLYRNGIITFMTPIVGYGANQVKRGCGSIQ